MREAPLAFNLRYPDSMRELEPARRRVAAPASAKGSTSSSSSRWSCRPTRATSAASCPSQAARELEALRERFPDLEPVEEGKARINQVAGYSIVFRASRSPRLYGRLVLLPQAAPARVDGVKLLMLANPDARRRQGARRRRARRAQDAVPQLPVRHRGPMTIDFDQFLAVDMRVGRVIAVEDFPEARKPAWKLTIDFGDGDRHQALLARRSRTTRREELEGRRVVAVVNFPPRQIGPVRSEVLVLGASDEQGRVILLAPDADVPLGARIH